MYRGLIVRDAARIEERKAQAGPKKMRGKRGLFTKTH